MKMVYKIIIKSCSSKTKAQRSVVLTGHVIIIITTQTFKQIPKSGQLAAELAAPATC